MSGQTPASLSRRGVVVPVIGLLVLIGVAATRLDRSELSASEGAHAQAALGSFEKDPRGVPERSPWSGGYASWRGWAYAAGTTERSLRLPVMLGLLLAAAVVAEAVSRLAPFCSRGVVYLLFAASPMLHRSDLLHPALFAAMPTALLLGGAVHARGGSWWWLAGAALGGAGIVVVDPRMTPIAAAGVLATSAASIRMGRGLLLVAVAGGAVAAAAGATTPGGPPGTWSAGDPGRGFLAAWPWLLLVGSGWALAAMRASTRRSALAGAAAFAAAAAATVMLLPSAPYESWTLHGVVLIFAVSALTDVHRPSPGSLVPLAAAVLALAACYPAVRVPAGYDPEGSGSADRDPIRGALAEARAAAVPGGRLVVAGPDRLGVLYYVRRGHDPGIPVLLIPEDVSEDGLARLLRHQLRAAPGHEDRLPPILYRPPPDSRLAPPGLAVALDAAPTSRRILRLRLSPEPPR